MLLVILLSAGAGLSAGTGLGWVLHARTRKAARQTEGAWCRGCRHHASFHIRAKLSCMKSACSCQVYSGPEPLPEYYAPEIQ